MEQAAFEFAVDPTHDEIATLAAEIRSEWRPTDYEDRSTADTLIRVPLVCEREFFEQAT